ncbi:MAG: PD-(D/E)XK nuclease family protein [Alistipes sp.]|nr:PD-(D/E)XK nuclease family protein [Alistipes sp.]
MKPFVSLLAEELYDRYGDDISSLCIIFPSRRAGLFFTDALASYAGKPLWQPEFGTVDQVMQLYSGLRCGEKIPLVADLYKVYSGFHRESFDSFYYWGEMLLSDFDSIDKYLIDAGMLFRNVAELKEIEQDNSYLTPEQAQIISRFWRSFGHEDGYSGEKRKFLDIWTTLHDIYRNYRSVLSAKGTGYGGMVYRQAAENIRARKLPEDKTRYVFAGFNALSECEKVLFKYLAADGRAEFFWDYDDYYTGDREQEAGLFIRENISRFPGKVLGPTDNFSRPKKIHVVSTPSDSLQCKYTGQVLSDLCKDGRTVDKETAVVLTDENLMLPVLSSIPGGIRDINVTMGYPLKLTAAYTLFERLAEMQARKRVKADKPLYRYADLAGLMSHPFVVGLDGAIRVAEFIHNRQFVYPDISGVVGPGTPLSVLLRDGGSRWEEFAEYLMECLSSVASSGPLSGDGKGPDRDHLALVADTVRMTTNSLLACHLELSPKIFVSLLRKILQNTRIPFEGEPLKGVQVMGILETRNLDFKNIILLSASDDNFPGNRVTSYSFIPHNLRYAYGLPTPAHHEGVYAYYFYRLLQRAENIHLVYSSKTDEKSSGERSRYIYQLQYESPHRLTYRSVGLDINVSRASPVGVDKIGETAATLNMFLSGEKQLSPSSFNNYVACPLKFYFHTIAGLKGEEEPGEEIDAPMFGTILHRAMDILFRPLCGVEEPRPEIRKLIGTASVSNAVEEAVRLEYLKGDNLQKTEYGGNLLLVSDIISRYIDKCILPFDASGAAFRIDKTEEAVSAAFGFRIAGRPAEVKFRGNADRIDLLPDGKVRVVDYKTGREELTFNGTGALFSPLLKDRNPSALQTMLYGLMISRTTGKDVQPALYYVRNLNTAGYSPLLKDRSANREVSSYHAHREDFEPRLSDKLSELFDLSIPFGQCEDVKTCALCDFRKICKR